MEMDWGHGMEMIPWKIHTDHHTQELIQSVSDNAETWRTLYPFTKMDLPVIEVKDMAKKYTDQIHNEAKKIVGEIFGINMKKEAMELRPRNWKEPHLLLYQRLENRPDYLGTEIHYDGCDITWSAGLNASITEATGVTSLLQNFGFLSGAMPPVVNQTHHKRCTALLWILQ